MTVIQANLRSEQGTSASRRLRNENKTPAIVYGLGETLAITIDHKEIFFALQKESFFTQVLKLNIDGKEHNVIVRDYQMHPVKRQVQHVDFQAIDLDKPVRIKLPIHLKNAEISKAVKLQSGRVALLASTVDCLVNPKNIPAHLDLNCEKVEAGQVLHLTDITYPEGVQSVALKRDNNLAVATVMGKKG